MFGHYGICESHRRTNVGSVDTAADDIGFAPENETRLLLLPQDPQVGDRRGSEASPGLPLRTSRSTIWSHRWLGHLPNAHFISRLVP